MVTCLEQPTLESTGALMKHRDVAVILATGGSGLVRAAYSSGKPAYGVGPGNVPAYIDRSANPREVAEHIVTSQSFDNGTLCCSEQGLVIDAPVYDKVLSALAERGAHLCSADEVRLLENLCNQGGHMNPKVVGQDLWKVAEMAGFHVARSTTVLLAPQAGVGPEHKLSIEILCPLLSVHKVDGWQQGCEQSIAMLKQGGLGHTLSIHCKNDEVLEAFFLQKPASRIVVNGPSSQGAVGFSTNLMPSFSLGCSPLAGNITSDNITARHLITIKRAAVPKADWKALERRFHERAAAMTGEAAPRGSGLPGDPGLRRLAPGSQPEEHRPLAIVQPVAPAPRPQPHAAMQPIAPTFTRPAQVDRPGSAPAPGHPLGAPDDPRGGGPVRESRRLPPDPGRDQGILEHAGSGCPMGPCSG
ncbi:MAG: aldehyde dehydrogenase family protein [Planctomycetota bacterium]